MFQEKKELKKVKLRQLFVRLNFTKREKDISYLLMDGLSDKIIASMLGVSVSTTRKTFMKALKKVGVSNRYQFIIKVNALLLEFRS